MIFFQRLVKEISFSGKVQLSRFLFCSQIRSDSQVYFILVTFYVLKFNILVKFLTNNVPRLITFLAIVFSFKFNKIDFLCIAFS